MVGLSEDFPALESRTVRSATTRAFEIKTNAASQAKSISSMGKLGKIGLLDQSQSFSLSPNSEEDLMLSFQEVPQTELQKQ